MVLWKTFNIRGIFLLHKRFFRFFKCSSHLENKWFFLEPFLERFFMKPKTILLWHCCEIPLLEPLFSRLWIILVFSPQIGLFKIKSRSNGEVNNLNTGTANIHEWEAMYSLVSFKPLDERQICLTKSRCKHITAGFTLMWSQQHAEPLNKTVLRRERVCVTVSPKALNRRPARPFRADGWYMRRAYQRQQRCTQRCLIQLFFYTRFT